MAIKRKVVLDRKPRASTQETPVTTPVTPAPVRTPVAATATTPAAPAPVTTVVDEGGKFRRLKDNGVAKVKRFERELCCSDRDIIIRWWNHNQRLVPKEDPVCATLTALINQQSGVPLSPMQVAGYFSYLCRLGQWNAIDRAARLDRNLARGAFSVQPEYSRDLLNAIVENWNKERQDEALRASAHAQMRAARAAGQHLRIRSGDGVRVVMQPAQSPVRAPAVPAAPAEEVFDIKWM